jgi:predicted secreted acid phosphatase
MLLGRWQDAPRTEVAPMPGAVTALRAIRARGVTVIFNSNRDAGKASETAATMANAGLGPVRHGETLFLRGDADGESGKDGRRSQIAKRWCVIAMAGDQLGDFSDRFNARDVPVAERRRLAATRPLASLWGNGWFMLSNPVYGPGLRGRIDEVFPADARWTGER